MMKKIAKISVAAAVFTVGVSVLAIWQRYSFRKTMQQLADDLRRHLDLYDYSEDAE
jgi:hypothetical protein